MSKGWWPIEAAPLDGTTIDLWVSGWSEDWLGSKKPARRIANCYWDEPQDGHDARWRIRDLDGEGIAWSAEDEMRGQRATHWRSIPSGPSKT